MSETMDVRHTTGIHTRERCADCREISAVGFHVPDDVWEAAVHPSLRSSILCLRCFARRADARLIEWDSEIKLFPVSLVTHLWHNREDLATVLDEAENAASRKRRYGPFRGVRAEGIAGADGPHWLGTCPNCEGGILFGESYYHGKKPIDCPFCEHNEAHDYHKLRT